MASSLIVGFQLPAAVVQAQDYSGFRRVEGKYLDVITDLPVNDEIRRIPEVFAAAIPIWCKTFDVDPATVEDWHGEVFIMLDRNRFESAGLIPAHLPSFPYGFQYGNQMWVSEQPSTYYRRHLVLHEGTHWFMNRLFGANGPPWVMEGMAEWLGTHHWDPATGELKMPIIPEKKEQVPYWGRISRIQEQLKNGSAPALETIMQYGSTAHREVDAYAWSWAAVCFMKSHPDTREAFDEMLKQPMRADRTQASWLFRRLSNRWESIREQWNAYVTDLQYGFDSQAGLLRITNEPKRISSVPINIEVDSSRSWQASGIVVTKGQTLQIDASGEFVVRVTSKPWRCFPDGVTLEYHDGKPLGRLMMTIVAPQRTRSMTVPIETIDVGSSTRLVASKTGEVHFRVNESSRGLLDNVGTLSVKLTPISTNAK